MVLPGHLAGGYLATRALLAISHPGFSVAETDTLLIIGTLAGELPDIDLVRWYFDAKGDHRDYFTHAPFFWLLISLAIAAAGYFFGSLFTEWVGWLVLAGSWSHLMLDSIEYGVMWLWPISSKSFVLKKEVPPENIAARPGSPSHHFKYVTGVYMKTISFWLEMIVSLAGACLLLSSL